MEAQMTQSRQSNPGRKEQDWRYNPSRLQTILQNYTNQKKKTNKKQGIGSEQTHISMEQNRQPRNKPTHLWSINL